VHRADFGRARWGWFPPTVPARAGHVARSVMEPTGHPASLMPPRRVRDVGPTFGVKRCCGLALS
jgi:hypothetical protein